MKAADRILARRYARAFVAACGGKPRAGVEALAAQRVQLDGVMEYLASPLIPARVKSDILNGRLPASKGAAAFSLLELLLSVRRFNLLDAVLAEAQALCDEREGIVLSRVVSAAPLDGESAAVLKRALERLSGAKVRLETAEDAALIGGFTARVADTLVDASARGAAERLKKQISGGVY